MTFLEKIFGENYKEDKKEYKEYKQRMDNLPEDYQVVMKNVQKYMWTAGPMDGGLPTLYAIMDLFEEGVAEGKNVLDITGPDVAAFAKKMGETSGEPTWVDTVAEKTNEKVQKQLKDIGK